MVRSKSLPVLVITSLAALSFGCAPDMVYRRAEVLALRAEAVEVSSAEPGIQIAVQALNYEDLDKERVPILALDTRQRDVDSRYPVDRRFAPPVRRPAVPVRQRIPLVPLPALAVAILNRTPHPLDLSATQISLEGAEGRSYRVAESAVEVATAITAVDGRLGFGPPSRWLIERVSRLPLVDKSVVIAPGGRFDGLIVVDFREAGRFVGLGLDPELRLRLASKDDNGINATARLVATTQTIEVTCRKEGDQGREICRPSIYDR